MAITKKAIQARTRRRSEQIRRDPAMRLLDAVGRYVKARGGEVLVAGPIGLVRDVLNAHHHELVIHFTGRAPKDGA